MFLRNIVQNIALRLPPYKETKEKLKLSVMCVVDP